MSAIWSPFVRAQIKENIKAPRHWPLQGKFTGDRRIPLTKASNVENVSSYYKGALHGFLTLLFGRYILLNDVANQRDFSGDTVEILTNKPRNKACKITCL